jgi:arginase
MVDLIGVALDACSRRTGSRLGPEALRLAGIGEALGLQGRSVRDRGDLGPGAEGDAAGGFRAFGSAAPVYGALRTAVSEALGEGRIAVAMGGDHSLSMGSIAGAMSQGADDLAVLWIDAHADLNVPATSPSGNLHGMPVAALLGWPSGVDGERDRQWRWLTNELLGARLGEDRVGWIGLRMVDQPGEAEALGRLGGGFVTTIQDVDRYGMEAVVREFDVWLRGTGARRLWISFDVDALDPFLAPGTGTAVRGGLSYREAHLCAELLHARMAEAGCPYRLVGLDVVEVNPLIDRENETARMAVEWVASLFGKTILGGTRTWFQRRECSGG